MTLDFRLFIQQHQPDAELLWPGNKLSRNEKISHLSAAGFVLVVGGGKTLVWNFPLLFFDRFPYTYNFDKHIQIYLIGGE